MQEYANLHVHSEYSLLDGAARVVDLASTAKKAGHKYLALTDHGSLSGALRHKKACDAIGVKPIYGCELYMMENFVPVSKRKDEDLGIVLSDYNRQQNLHLSVLAKNQRGFEQIIEGLNYAYSEGLAKAGKARRAFLPVDWPLTQGWAGNVVIMSGCANSPFWNASKETPEELYAKYNDAFKDDFYSEIMPIHDWKEQLGVNEVALALAKHMGRKWVATNDIHYCREQDSILHELVLCMGQFDMTWNNPKRWKFETHLSWLRPADAMIQSLLQMGMDSGDAHSALTTTLEIAEKCYFDLKKYSLDLPSPLPFKDEEEEVNYFMNACTTGMKKRGLDSEVYWERLAKEIDLIISKKFQRYMLIVADAIQWTKRNGITVGPGRGSVGGSLIAYVLEITEIDPIRHDLPFERFVAPDRFDLPDIDLDISDSERHLVEKYLTEKYGAGNVAHIPTYTSMRGKSALRDVARVFEVSHHEINEASKLVIHRHKSEENADETIQDTINLIPEFRPFYEKYTDIVHYAGGLEGLVKGTGVHAAGFAISSKPFAECKSSYLIPTKEGKTAVNWDKDDIEYFGFVKIDLLGLATITVLQETMRSLKDQGIDIELSKVPLDDKASYETISNGETAALFQISTPALTSYCKQLQPETFEDLAALTALWRPGPIQAGMAAEYVEVRHGRKKPTYPCPEYENIVKKTRGQLIYQEQITQLLTDLAGYTYVEADKVRKFISKSQGIDKLKEHQSRFISGCIAKKTLTEGQAKALWEKLVGFGLYAFNKAHSVAYGLISYLTAYFKTNHTAEYLCAFLNYGRTARETDEGSYLDVALKESTRLGINILPPDINRSYDKWRVVDGKLMAGLSEVRFFGDTARTEFMKIRAQQERFADLPHFLSLVPRRIFNKRVIKSLLFAGAFDSLPGEWDLWRKNYEELYETLFKPEKHIVAMEKAKTMPEPAERRETFLNYNEGQLIEIANSGNQIVELLGNGYEYVDGMICQKSDGVKWSLSDALAGQMVGLKAQVLKNQKKSLKELKEKVWSCDLCELRKSCDRPVPIDGGQMNLMILTEAPGKYEDVKGRQLVGDAGKLLFDFLAEAGFDRSNFYIDSCLHCRPPKSKTPNFSYIDGCPHLETSFEVVKPVAVLALGKMALYRLKKLESGIMKMSGTSEWHPKYKCWVTYCVSPASLLYGERKESMIGLFKRGIEEFQRLVFQLGGKQA